jgi:hypothetical protein
MTSMNTEPATSLNATPMRTNSSKFLAEYVSEEEDEEKRAKGIGGRHCQVKYGRFGIV